MGYRPHALYDRNLSKYNLRIYYFYRPISDVIHPSNRLLRKFCVSEFRQNQEFHVINVHNEGLFPLTTPLPIEHDGMRAARGVNAVALYRES